MTTSVKTNFKLALLLAAILVNASVLTTAASAQRLMQRLPVENPVRQAIYIQSLREVTYQLEDFIAVAAEAGYSEVVANERIGMLNSGMPASVDVRLERGTAYAFAAACDNDCSHLRLVLRDASGQVIKGSTIRTTSRSSLSAPTEPACMP